MTFYNLRSNPSGELPYTVTKFADDLEVESSYAVGRTVCECPAGHRPSCRHRDMLHILTTRVDTAWFWCFETKRWEDPTGQAQVEETGEGVEADPLPEEEEAMQPTQPYVEEPKPVAKGELRRLG